MQYQAELAAMRGVVSAEWVDLTSAIDASWSPAQKRAWKQCLRSVEVYRLVYKVKRLQVVGYIAVPVAGEQLPCLLHLRGGSREFGAIVPRGLLMNIVRYAAEGFVVITTQYPGVEGGDGHDGFGGEDDIRSITKLRDVLKQLAVADHTNLGVKGHSRGGLMVYMLLREVTWVKAAMASAAPVDQVKQKGEREGWRAMQKRMWGGDRDGAIRRSPLRWVDELPTRVPLLLMQGSADWRVDPQHSFDMSAALRAREHPHRFICFEGADHGISEYRGEYHRQTLDWFTRWLKQKEALPNMQPHGR